MILLASIYKPAKGPSFHFQRHASRGKVSLLEAMNKFVLLSLAALAVGIGIQVTARRNGGKKMVCYVGTWAVYRPGDGKFEMEDIDPQLCTHIMYGFTKLENNEITVFDPWGDLTPNDQGGGKSGYKRFTDLRQKNPDLKALIAIGGWNEGSTKYSEMASNPSSRKKFVKSIVPFLQKYNFDGLDLDWEYPTQRGGKPEDRENFSALVRELREELNRAGKGYLLTAAVSPNTKTVEIGYEVPEIARNLDFINVMCYDYHGFWEGHEFTGHNTPLYRHPLDFMFEPMFNANDTVTYWLEAGLPKEKLIMGMALYGRGFTLEKPEQHGLYAPISGGIPQGPYTRQDGIWGYNEICEKYMTEMSQWKISIDPHIKAPYAFNDRHWIGYEDVESLYYKAEFARNMDLGGAMVWSLETDDFRGKCHGEKYPLLRTIVNTMNGGGMPSVPQRPEVVPPQEYPDTGDLPEESMSTTTTRRSTTRRRKTRRTTTTTPLPDDYYYEEDETTTTPAPTSRRTRRTRPPTRQPPQTTTPDDYENEIEPTERTTMQPPSDAATGKTRRTRKPRPSPSPDNSNNNDYDRPRPSTTPAYPVDDEMVTSKKTRRPRPTSSSGNNKRTTQSPSEPEIEEPSNPAAASGKCEAEGMFPAGNCSGFYQCVKRGNGYVKYERTCPPGTAYNPDIQNCDHASQVPGCSYRIAGNNAFRTNGI